MGESIYLLEGGDTLRPMLEQPYKGEDILQQLLEDYPDLLAGEQMNRSSPRRWVLVTREAAVPDSARSGGRWSLDHLFLDQDGVPTLVEVKRSSDTRIRREVVGQMLDYAANAVTYWSTESIKASFEDRCREQGADPAEAICQLVKRPVDDADAADSFWQAVNANLRAGRLRMVFVADEIPDELKTIVEFLNVQMSPAEVLAVEVKQFGDGEKKVLVPRVVGQTAAAQRAKSTGPREKRLWDESSFFAELEEKQGAEEARVARDIYEWFRSQGASFRWGTGTTIGSFTPVVTVGDEKLAFFYLGTNGLLGVNLYSICERRPFNDPSKLAEFVKRLGQVPGTEIRPDKKNPSMAIQALRSEDGMRQFKDTFEWAIGEATNVKEGTA